MRIHMVRINIALFMGMCNVHAKTFGDDSTHMIHPDLDQDFNILASRIVCGDGRRSVDTADREAVIAGVQATAHTFGGFASLPGSSEANSAQSDPGAKHRMTVEFPSYTISHHARASSSSRAPSSLNYY